MAGRLKVYRTPIGFHDAYVAAPSQRAALAAWGTETDLFARGAAELVTDPALAEEPLSNPGVVVKRLRGTQAEQLAALGPEDAPPAASARRAGKPAAAPKKVPPPKPPPSRRPVEEAEAVLADAQARQEGERQDLARRRAAVDEEERALKRRHAAERSELEKHADAARAAYEKALARWRG